MRSADCFRNKMTRKNGAIVHAELLTQYLKKELSIAVSCILNHKKC